MISSFFSKTKPINYAVLVLLLLIFYVLNALFHIPELIRVFVIGVGYVALVLQVIGVQEIVRTRKTTNNTTFAMLFFVLLFMAIPQVQFYNWVVFGNLFLMLSLNRILALKNLKFVKQKIFDATLWICAASIFDPWTLLFLGVVFLAIYVYKTKDFKCWLVPFVAIIFFLLLISAFLVLTDNMAFLQNHYVFKFEPNFFSDFISNFSFKPFLYIVSILGLVLVVFIRQGYQGVGRILHLRILLVYFLVAILVFCIQNVDTNNYLVLAYSFFPATVFATNFLETLKKKRLKEFILIGCILFPFVLMLLGFVK